MGKYFSLIKFSHTVFAMPFALIGFFLGVHHRHDSLVNWKLLALVIACMVFARSAAMAFNRYIDRTFDQANPRTRMREIPSGIISPYAALTFVVFNCLLFIATTWCINTICFALSPVALLVILGYSYTKRFTALCHLILGLGLSLAPIGAYLAVTGSFALVPILFSLCVLFWVGGFDILYAMQDEEFDRTQGLNSIPAFLGPENALKLSTLFHLLAILLLIGAGYRASFGFIYWSGLTVFTVLLAYQHSLVKPNNLQRVNLAFATTNGIASLVFSAFVIAELLA